MTNMIYSSNPKIIDILGEEKGSFVTCWFLLSKELCLDYSLFLCKGKKENITHHWNNFYINENKFKEFLIKKLDYL